MGNCQPNCGCKFEVDSSCVRYTSIGLGITSINAGDTVETSIIKIEEALYNLQQSFILRPATRLLLGGVKIGVGIDISDDGTISVPTTTAYTLPISTSTILGGVKIGSGINVTVDGTISVPTTTPYTLPTASSTVLGGVKIGNGLAIDGQGILSSNIGQGTLNSLAKFTPDGYSINDSQILDDGTYLSIGSTDPNPIPGNKSHFYISTSNLEGLKVLNTKTGANIAISGISEGQANGNANKIGVFGKSKGVTGHTWAYGVYGAAEGSQYNIGIVGESVGQSGMNIGVFGNASNGTSNYCFRGIDGTESPGKVLTCVGSGGIANWVDPNPQKTINTNYMLTSADKGYSIIIENGANPITITIPSGLLTSMQVGFIQDGTGDVTFTGSGTTLQNAISGFKIKGQYDQVYLEKKGTNEVYYLLGNVKV